MIPILYESNEKNFTSNGLGGLADAISCNVTEERNGEFELEMTYPITGLHYSEIKADRIIVAMPSDGADPEPFMIYKITRPLNGKVTVYAQHISYRLSYTATVPDGHSFNDAQSALDSLKASAASDCPFTFTTDVKTVSTFQHLQIGSIRSFLGGQQGSIIDQFGGEYKWSKWNVQLLTSRGKDVPITLEYGKDITDLQQEENIAATYSAVIAYWQNKDEDNGTTCDYSDLIKTSNADNFPYVKTFLYDCSSDYENEPTKEQLNQKAQSYINQNNIGVPSISITVSFVALWQTEDYKNVAALQHINLCDRISVSFHALGIEKATAKVVKTDFDVLKERYNSIELGDSRSTLASTIADGDTQTLQRANAQIELTEKAIISKVRSDDQKLQTQISQNESSIKAEVKARDDADKEINGQLELKVGKDDNDQVVSMLNASADVITLNSDRLEVNSTNFKLTKDGSLTANNGNFSGDVTADNITANNGTIAGYNVSSTGFAKGNTEMNSSSGNAFQAGNNFYVEQNGTLHATGAVIDGNITASTLNLSSGCKTSGQINFVGSHNTTIDDAGLSTTGNIGASQVTGTSFHCTGSVMENNHIGTDGSVTGNTATFASSLTVGGVTFKSVQSTASSAQTTANSASSAVSSLRQELVNAGVLS